jgi:hypothetical protein
MSRAAKEAGGSAETVRGTRCSTDPVPVRYLFFPVPPGLACVAENGDGGTPALGLGCFGFFGSLLLLSCPFAMFNSPAVMNEGGLLPACLKEVTLFDATERGEVLETASVIGTAPLSRGAKPIRLRPSRAACFTPEPARRLGRFACPAPSRTTVPCPDRA